MEEVVTFGSRQSLVGILTNPSPTALRNRSPGIIIIGAGKVHRVGPNRLDVKIARMLGQLGFTTLRFDFSGVGDSGIRTDNLPYGKSVILEAQEAMDCFSSAKGIQYFMLMGICTGAMNAFQIARRDPRVQGIILINPAIGLDQNTEAELSDYVSNRKRVEAIGKQNYLNPKNWWRALTGQSDYTNLRRILSFQVKSLLFGQKRLLPKTERAFDVLYQLIQQGLKVQIVLSGGEPQVKNNFGALLKEKLTDRRFTGNVLIDMIDSADHTFTSLSTQPQFFNVIKNFACKCSEQSNPHGQIRNTANQENFEEGNFQIR